jgi:hypothetical protein
MSAAHHTPGPWFPTRDSTWNSVCRIGRAWDISTKLPMSEMGHPDMDAHLICAAPEMLAELQHVEQHLSIALPTNMVERLRAVIAKATGATS